MSINTKTRIAILAAVVAIAAAAPAAFALDAGTTYRGMHTDPGGTPDAPAAMHSQEVMQKVHQSGAMMANTGTWYQSMHTDPGGSADAPAARHSQMVMQKTFAPGGVAPAATARTWVPNY
jgi:hypothetical protein